MFYSDASYPLRAFGTLEKWWRLSGFPAIFSVNGVAHPFYSMDSEGTLYLFSVFCQTNEKFVFWKSCIKILCFSFKAKFQFFPIFKKNAEIP